MAEQTALGIQSLQEAAIQAIAQAPISWRSIRCACAIWARAVS
jgi:hypothetical protein